MSSWLLWAVAVIRKRKAKDRNQLSTDVQSCKSVDRSWLTTAPPPRANNPTSTTLLTKGIKPFAQASTTRSMPQAPSPQPDAGADLGCEKRLLQVQLKTPSDPRPHGSPRSRRHPPYETNKPPPLDLIQQFAIKLNI